MQTREPPRPVPPITPKHVDELGWLYSDLPRAHLDAVVAAQSGTPSEDLTDEAIVSLQAAESEVSAIVNRIRQILHGSSG